MCIVFKWLTTHVIHKTLFYKVGRKWNYLARQKQCRRKENISLFFYIIMSVNLFISLQTYLCPHFHLYIWINIIRYENKSALYKISWINLFFKKKKSNFFKSLWPCVFCPTLSCWHFLENNYLIDHILNKCNFIFSLFAIKMFHHAQQVNSVKEYWSTLRKIYIVLVQITTTNKINTTFQLLSFFNLDFFLCITVYPL